MSIKPSLSRPLRIATRRSPLALAQTSHVRAQIAAALGIEGIDIETWLPIVPFVTTGDQNLRSSLADIGGKGLFTKEIESALLDGDADIAVHSMKDMPAALPDGLVIAAVPEREDPRDAFVTVDGRTLDDLGKGARIGTSSTRRGAQIKRLRPDLQVVPFRGNVGTRLRKLEDGEADGTFLAEAGLRRLGQSDVQRCLMNVERMLPALGQGILCLQTRADHEVALAACQSVHCAKTGYVSAAERAVTEALDGSCRTPMAGLGTMRGDTLYLVAEILTPDGNKRVTAADRIAPPADLSDFRAVAAEAGAALAQRLRDDAGSDLTRMLVG